jgi:hypothetical protein
MNNNNFIERKGQSPCRRKYTREPNTLCSFYD